MIKRFYLLALVTGCFSGLKSQSLDSFNLSDAISMALKNNLDVQVADLRILQSSNLTTLGQAGYFPSLSATGNGSYSQNNTRLEFAGGLPDVERDGAVNTSFGGNLGLSYVAFNGFGRKFTYQNLKKQWGLSEVQSEILTENTAFEVINKYANIQQSRLDLAALEVNLRISAERLKYTKLAYQSGTKTSLDVMNSEMDYRNDSLNIFQKSTSLEKEILALKLLMGQSPDFMAAFSNELPVPVVGSIDEVMEKALKSNVTLKLAELTLEISQNNVGISRSRLLPQLTLNAGYGAQQSQNGAGIILSQSTLGVNSSAALAVPIFNGGQLQTALKNAQLQVVISEKEREQVRLEIQHWVTNAFLDQSTLEMNISTLMGSVDLANLAIKRAQKSYQEGLISYNDLRQVQLNALQIQNALNIAQLNLLKLRYSMLRLSGELLMGK
jgi:outer membrane protein TolC